MIDALWLALRAAGLALSFQAAGTALFVAVFARSLGRAGSVIRRTGVRSACAALVVLLAQALCEPARMAGEWAGLGEVALLRLFLGSAAADTYLVRVMGLACVALGLADARRAPPLLALVGSLAVAGASLVSGHTSVAAHRLLLASLLLTHLTILAFWFGSLGPLRQLVVRESPAAAARVLAEFSAVAIWLVPLIALAGAAMAVLLLPDVAALARPYGLLLLAKLALFALLMALAALNRLRLAPALARGETLAALRLRRSLALEYALICAAFALTAVMTGVFAPTADA